MSGQKLSPSKLMTLVAYRAARDRLEPESAPGSKLMTLLAYRRLKEGVVRSPGADAFGV